MDLGYKKHFRVYHSKDEFVRGNSHINGIDSFWGLCKVRLSTFRGMSKKHLYLHLKECEFRFNCRDENLYYTVLALLRDRSLRWS